jgi:protein kinase-like protein/WD40 repeat protein
MGEVYRAHDTRLGRSVAIKILPKIFTADPDRLARFEREARVLASLNHPNIGAIYGIEEGHDDGDPVRALVLELVEGDTLAERVLGGALPVAEAIRIAVQIADALDAAHEKGIVHRDLKPSNVKLTPNGIVKVLDFGLATTSFNGDPDLTQSPTVTMDRTGTGVILGTVPYMSPEQTRGQNVDKRADIWAFGCVLFEMVTGKRAFDGATVSDTIARILERDVDWSALPADTPASVRRVLTRTLTKDLPRRVRDIGDVRLDLDEPSAPPSPTVADTTRASRSWRLVAAGLVAVLLIGAVVGELVSQQYFKPETPAQPVARLTIPLGPDESFARAIAVSPDGAYVAYQAGPPGNARTYLRSLADASARIVGETPTGGPSFFSPDSQWLGVFDSGKLKKISVHGGAATLLAEAPAPRGGTWAQNGSIVFSPAARTGLLWLPPTGGPPQVLTTPDERRGETSHRQPRFLPDAKIVIFTAEGDTYAQRSLAAVSLETRQATMLSQGETLQVQYLPTGHLAYLEGNKIVVVPFDVRSLKTTGPTITVLEGVGGFGISSTGMLVYGAADATATAANASSLVWVARDGTETRLPLPPQRYDHPRVSPDDRRIVFNMLNGTDRSLWVYDTARDATSRFTLESSNNWPVWSTDGTRILYASNRPGTQWDIFAKHADGSGTEEKIFGRPWTQIPRVVSPDGKRLVYTETDPNRGDTLWTMSLNDPADTRPLLDKTPGEETPTFSPDGRWIAYVTPESGRREVYVRSAAGMTGKWQITSGGGSEPVWSPAGRELFYRVGNKMMAVDVESSRSFRFGKPHVLFEGSYIFATTEGQEYDVSHDARRFLMLKPQEDVHRVVPLNVIVNWFEDLKRR